MESVDGMFGIRLHHVGNDQVAQIRAIAAHVKDRAYGVALLESHAVPSHELGVSHQHLGAIHQGADTVAAFLLGSGHALIGTFARS